MPSESTRQGKLLESNFLDKLGAKDPGLQLDETEKVFVKWMGKLVERLQSRLNEAGANGREITASGNLSESIRFEYRKDGQNYIGEIYMADYADYVDKGVQGIGADNQNTTSPYKFKYAFPSKDMQKALILWVREKSFTEKYTTGQGEEGTITHKGLLGRYTKNYLRNKTRANTLAVAIGISIKRRGLRPVNFKQGVISEFLPEMARDLSKSLARDIKVSINTTQLN